jgi:hypothetical protein
MSEARRVDHGLGIVEEAEFFGSGPGRIFGIRYQPAAKRPVAGVVMCDPILAQFRAHYRSGVLTARAMAARGLVVQRFHYRGTGNSDGDVSRMDLMSMTADAVQAAHFVRSRFVEIPMAFLGINLGSYPAAAASIGGEPLILDSPPPSGRQYFRNALRAHAVYKLRRDTADGLTMTGLVEELNRPGSDVSLLGCRLSLGLYESISSTTIVDEVRGAPRPLLLFGLGDGGVLRPDGEAIRSALTDREFEVEVQVRSKVDPFWYVENSAPEDQPETAQTADRVRSWLDEWLPGHVPDEAVRNA